MKDEHVSLHDVPVLEAEINELEDLNDLREKAIQLKKDGLEGLTDILLRPCDSGNSKLELWVDDATEEPEDYVKPALIAMALSRAVDTNDKQNECRKKQLANLDRIQFNEILNVTSRSRVPIFQAARVLQAKLHSPKEAFSEAAMISLYRLVYELNCVSDANWSVGGARAREGAPPTAFVTGECIRGIRSLTRLIDRCQETTEHIRKRLDHLELLLSNPKVEEFDLELPEDWLESEINRVCLELHTVIRSRGRRTFLAVHSDTIEALNPSNSSLESSKSWLNTFFFDLATTILSMGQEASDTISVAISQVKKRYNETIDNTKSGSINHRQTQMAHAVGEDALVRLKQLAQDTKKIGKELLAVLEGSNLTANSVHLYSNKLKDFAKLYATAYNATQQLLAPARAFSDSVLDRELGKVELGNFDAGELACAAASISELGGNELDPRLDSAINALSKKIGHNGEFPIPSVLGTDVKGYTLVLVGSEIIRSYAQLLENTKYRVTPERVRGMLRYFEAHAIRFPEGGKLVGWTHDHPIFPRRAVRWTTALAILALDRVIKLLGTRINNAVFRHFSVKEARQLESAPSLSDLIYPDHGIGLHDEKGAKGIETNQVSHLLQRMRCHLRGVTPPPSFYQACYSAVFYGPPGTGKSTYSESLAKTADVPLVEITPSDIVVEGESHMERRTRAVFKALSYLTRCVIVFDEFEHLLTSRQNAFKKDSKNLFDMVVPAILPKLKTLHESAKDQQVVYIMNTNYVGELDNAAIRSGRFDFKVGVFPPDPVTRAGAFIFALRQVLKTTPQVFERALNENRTVRVIAETAGAGMTWLVRKGNLRSLREGEQSAPQRTMLQFVLDPSIGEDGNSVHPEFLRQAIVDAILPPIVIEKARDLLDENGDASNSLNVIYASSAEAIENTDQVEVDRIARRDANHYGTAEIDAWARIVAWDAIIANSSETGLSWKEFIESFRNWDGTEESGTDNDAVGD